MKKAKVLLASIGLFAVIGGTVAFKAQHGKNGTLFCTTIYGTTVNSIPYVITASGPGRYCTFTITGRGYIYYTRVTLNI